MMLTVRRVKENDLLWLAKATGAKVVRDFDTISGNDIRLCCKGLRKNRR